MLLPLGNTDPAQLDRRVVLQARTTTRDAVGGRVETWADLATVWASRRVESGRKYFSGEQKTTEQAVVFRIRYRTGLAAFMRISFGGEYFEVVQKPVELGRRAYLDLITRTVHPTPADFGSDFAAEDFRTAAA